MRELQNKIDVLAEAYLQSGDDPSSLTQGNSAALGRIMRGVSSAPFKQDKYMENLVVYGRLYQSIRAVSDQYAAALDAGKQAIYAQGGASTGRSVKPGGWASAGAMYGDIIAPPNNPLPMAAVADANQSLQNDQWHKPGRRTEYLAKHIPNQ